MATASYFLGMSNWHGAYALQGHFDLLTFDLDIMTFTLKVLSGPLLGSETIHANCFICTGGSFWPSTLKIWHPPWKFCLGKSLEAIHSNYFIFSGQINITSVCVLWGYFDILLRSCNWPPRQFCLGHCSQKINGNSFIFYVHINLTWNLCDLDMTFTLKILSSQLLDLTTIHSNCFIFSGHINLTSLHCDVILNFWPLIVAL